MIAQLTDLGKKLRKDKSKKGIVHDALKEEKYTIIVTIDKNGNFKSILPAPENRKTTVEFLERTSGKIARLLVDNINYTFGYFNCESKTYNTKLERIGKAKAEDFFKTDAIEKHELYLNKLQDYSDLIFLKPVILFFSKDTGIKSVTSELLHSEIGKKERDGNVVFLIEGEKQFVHENEAVYAELIKNYEKALVQTSRYKCTICNSLKYPIELVHGKIKNVPAGLPAGCSLVSYNKTAFESYGLEKSLNTQICTNCAKTYVEALNWLLGNKKIVTNKQGEQNHVPTNRKDMSDNNTAVVFWTKNNQKIQELNLLSVNNEFDLFNPFETSMQSLKYPSVVDDVSEMLKSLYTTKKGAVHNLEADQFYALILSGASARIIIRSWIELTIRQMQMNIAKWFEDISIVVYIKPVIKRIFFSIQRLSNSCAVNKKNDKDKDPVISIVGTQLWQSALLNTPVSLNILDKVLRRIKTEQGRIPDARAALIKLILNRNNKGGIMIKEELDQKNKSTAYICGRIFALLESIQRAALGKNINAGIRERFFSSASTSPSLAFGRLLKLSQNHLSKLKNSKPGLAIVLDRELQELFSHVEVFPAIFSLEEQGQFAIGYYHQKQDIFKKAAKNKELNSMLEGEEDNE